MADVPQQTPVQETNRRSVKISVGLGILFMLVVLLGFWVIFIKPLEFAGKAAMNGLNPANQTGGAVIEKFDVTINAKGERMVVGQDPQKILEALKEAKPASAPVTGSKPPSP